MLSTKMLISIPLLPKLPPTNKARIGPLVRMNPLMIIQSVSPKKPFVTHLKQNFKYKKKFKDPRKIG